ncbi:MAG TPA: tRNA pseudouridine(38-40) synthase TruA [Methylotenera sp.]|nr:tRNA pseudouridine(38-40) synthase TruA [Methylotenera sp.]
MRIALCVEYDGTPYCGWQSQTNACGVQDFLEGAIKSIAGHAIRVHAAGRTDTGVHALAQIIHFDTEAARPESAWVRGVNAFLPASIRVLWAKAVTDEFHARFSAQQRKYQYLLVNAPVAPAIMASKAGWYHLSLDVTAMQTAITYLRGEHDFSAFRASECQAKSPIKNLQIAIVHKFGEQFVFEFSANAFLQHQVRNMVGALIYVGNGKQPPTLIQDLLIQKNRTLSPPTFSANGLYLVGVQYDEKFGLPSTQRSLSDIY